MELASGKKDCLREREYVVTSEKEKIVECMKDEEHIEMLTGDEISEFIDKVKYYLNATQNAWDREAKAQIALKLFQFMSSPKSIRFMKDNKKFGTTVLAKLNEMQTDFKAMPKYNLRFQFISETISRRMK